MLLCLIFVCSDLCGQQQSNVLKSGFVQLKDGDRIKFVNGKIGGTTFDFAQSVSQQNNRRSESINLEDIELIQHKLKSKALQGMGVGLAIGGGIMILGLLDVSGDNSRRLKDNWYVPAAGIIGLSGLIGALVGSSKHHVETIYEPSTLSGQRIGLGIEMRSSIGPKLTIALHN